MSCNTCQPPSSNCTPFNPCPPENYGGMFPSLVGPAGPPGGPGLYVSNYDELRALDAQSFPQGYIANVGGHTSINDGGQGEFMFDLGSTAADNDGTILSPTNAIGRWLRRYSPNMVLVDWWGPVHTDAQVQAAINILGKNVGGTVILGSWTYVVSNNIAARGNNNFRMLGQGRGISILDSSATVDINTNPNGNLYCGTLAVGDDTGVGGVGGSLTTNIYLADFTIKSSTSALVPVKNKGLLFQCAAFVTFERLEMDGGYREGIVGFGNEYANLFTPYSIRVLNCRFKNAPTHAVFQTFPGSYDVVLDGNHVEDCVLGLFCFSMNAVVTNNTFLRVGQSCIYIGEGYDNDVGRTYGPTVVANNTMNQCGYNGTLGGQVWAIRCTGSRSVYHGGTGDGANNPNTEDIGLIIANNSILNSVCPGGGAVFTAISIVGSAMATNNYIAGCTGGAARYAFDIQKGVTPSNPGTLGNTKVFLKHNVVDKTILGTNDFSNGINVEASSTIELYCIGNTVARATALSFQNATGGGGTAFVSFSGDILNGPTSILGEWDSGFSNINPSGGLNNIPISGATNRTLSTPNVPDLFTWPITSATPAPDTKGCRCNWYLYDGGAPFDVTGFQNGVRGQIINVTVFLTNATFINYGALSATENLVLNGAVDYPTPPQRTAISLKYITGNPVIAGSAWYEQSRSEN